VSPLALQVWGGGQNEIYTTLVQTSQILLVYAIGHVLDAVERSTQTLDNLDFEVLSLRAEALEEERDMENCPCNLNFVTFTN